MGGPPINERGNTYGRLTVVSQAQNRGKTVRWHCACDCGSPTVVDSGALRNGHTKSCGCLQREVSSKMLTKHGLFDHPVYSVWSQMKERTRNPKNVKFPDYGGRGISICKEWLDFATFYQWARTRWKRGLQIDRRDNDGNYEPGNCRFVTPSLNVTNRRKQKSNKSGYVGVSFFNRDRCYRAYLGYKTLGGAGRQIHLGYFPTKEEAVTARNNFITANNSPHKIQQHSA